MQDNITSVQPLGDALPAQGARARTVKPRRGKGRTVRSTRAKITRSHPEVHARALELAGGDKSLLVIRLDGIIVANNIEQARRWRGR